MKKLKQKVIFEPVNNCQYIFYPHITKNEFIIGSFVLLTLFSWYLFKSAETRIEYILTGIVIGGALGNLLERIISGCVTDYINLFGLFHFNFWDLMISLGVFFYLFSWVKSSFTD